MTLYVYREFRTFVVLADEAGVLAYVPRWAFNVLAELQ